MTETTTRPSDQEPTVKIAAAAASVDPRALRRNVDSGRTIVAGILGGIASAVGYAVYQRLPDDQRDRLHEQVRSLIASRLNEFRSTFNI